MGCSSRKVTTHFTLRIFLRVFVKTNFLEFFYLSQIFVVRIFVKRASDLQKLNVFQNFVCKNSLNLPNFCRSDICESFFGVLPIEVEIDTPRKTVSHSTILTKKIFAIRLYSFIYNLAQKQKGFIPEIFDIIQKYELTDHLKQWLYDGRSCLLCHASALQKLNCACL